MLIKFLTQVTLTCLIVQIVNVTFDEFILTGVAKIVQSLAEADDAEQKSKSKEKFSVATGLSLINGRFFTNFTNMTSYTQAIVNILIGGLIIVYMQTLLFQTWRFLV